MAHPDFLKQDIEINVPLLDGSNTRPVKTSELLDCIQPRMEELLEQVERCASVYGYKTKNLPLVGVITGGGSLMPGLPTLCMNVLGLKEVRRGCVQRDLVTSSEEYFAPVYSTAMALAIYSSDSASLDDGSFEQGASVTEKVQKFFKGLFG